MAFVAVIRRGKCLVFLPAFLMVFLEYLHAQILLAFSPAVSRHSKACLLFSLTMMDCLIFVWSLFPGRVGADADSS